MTCSGNPKADRLGCQWTLTRWCLQNFCSMVHREANRFKALVLCGCTLKQNGWCTAKQVVHSKARNGALRSKFRCTPKQEMVHCEARFSALWNNATPHEPMVSRRAGGVSGC